MRGYYFAIEGLLLSNETGAIMPRRLKEKTWLEILNEAKSKRRTTIGGIPGWKADFSYFNKNQKPLFGVRFFIEYTNSEKIRTTFYFPAGTTMKAARQLALEARSKIESGIDIQKVRLEEKKSLRIVASTEDTTTKQSYLFENVFEEWVVFSKKNGKWRFNEKGEIQARRLGNKHILPVLGQLHIPEIQPIDLANILNPLYLNHSATGENVYTLIRSIFRFALASHRFGLKNSPIGEELSALTEVAKKHKQSEEHFPALPFTQLPEFIKALLSLHSSSSLALAFSILTATRGKAFREAKWSDIDFENAVWNISISSDKRKEKYRNRTVYLSRQALDFLTRIPPTSPYIFSSGYTAKPLVDSSICRCIQNMHLSKFNMDGIGWVDPLTIGKDGRPRMITQHGTARAGFHTWACDDSLGNNLKFDERTIELCLLHEPKALYGYAYNRATMEKSRRTIMQAWSDYVLSGVSLDSYLPRLSDHPFLIKKK